MAATPGRRVRAAGGVDPYEVFSSVALEVVTGGVPVAPPASLWEGLEAFPAYGDEIEPAPLAALVTEVLGIAPNVCGLVDHQQLADEWERSRGGISLVERLLAALG